MQRRTFVAAAGAGMTALAGCLGDGDAEEDGETETETETETPTPTETATATPEPVVDEDRVHSRYSSGNEDEFTTWGWVRTADVDYLDPQTEERLTIEASNRYFFQTEVDLGFGIEFEISDVELVILSNGNRYTPIEELPDGTTLSQISDVGEYTLREAEYASTDVDHRHGYLRAIYDIEEEIGEGDAVIDISPFIPDAEAPRYIEI